MKTYLITGCAGFIGSNFVHYMLKKYPEILLVNLDKLTYAGNLENLKDVEGDPRHVFVVLMLSKLGASGWAGDICSALVWPALLATEYERGRPIQRQLQLVSAAEVLRLVFWMLTKYAGMSGLAFWTNIMFVLLTCARGWAGLTLYKTQEETL